MNTRRYVLVCLSLIALIVYLFATAPAPLPERTMPDATIPIATVLTLAESENDAMRALWTRDIVGAGQQAGLQFNEDWNETGEQAGPLPALFLRETARMLERDPVRLSLFLGSDAPINPANRFEGVQQEHFRQIRATGSPQFFRMPDTGLYTAMFPDEAVAEPCVNCHNEHEDSPRNDWALHDVMGATTWAYPDAYLSNGDMLVLLVALRSAFRSAYEAYLDKASGFDNPPLIGERWPSAGYYLPSADVFMAEHARRTALGSLESLLSAVAQGTHPPPDAEAESTRMHPE